MTWPFLQRTNPLAIPAMEKAVEHSQAHLIVTERQIAPPVQDSIRLCAILVVSGLIAAKFVPVLLLPLLFVMFAAGGVHLAGRRHRAIGVLAYPGYFLVVRGDEVRRGWKVVWDSLKGPGEVVAVLEQSSTLRLEERAESKQFREVFVFADGRMNVLLSSRMSEDEGIVLLHQVQEFLARHASGFVAGPAIQRAAPEPVPQPVSEDRPVSGKGTLK